MNYEQRLFKRTDAVAYVTVRNDCAAIGAEADAEISTLVARFTEIAPCDPGDSSMVIAARAVNAAAQLQNELDDAAVEIERLRKYAVDSAMKAEKP